MNIKTFIKNQYKQINKVEKQLKTIKLLKVAQSSKPL